MIQRRPDRQAGVRLRSRTRRASSTRRAEQVPAAPVAADRAADRQHRRCSSGRSGTPCSRVSRQLDRSTANPGTGCSEINCRLRMIVTPRAASSTNRIAPVIAVNLALPSTAPPASRDAQLGRTIAPRSSNSPTGSPSRRLVTMTRVFPRVLNGPSQASENALIPGADACQPHLPAAYDQLMTGSTCTATGVRRA